MRRRITPSYTKNPSKPNTTPLETVSLFSSQSRLQLNFNTSVYLQAFRRNICSSRLADPGIFAVSVRARKPIRSSDVSGLCYIITGGGGGGGREGGGTYITETADLISRVYRVCCKRIARRNGRHFPSFPLLDTPEPRIYIYPGIIPCSTRFNVSIDDS